MVPAGQMRSSGSTSRAATSHPGPAASRQACRSPLGLRPQCHTWCCGRMRGPDRKPQVPAPKPH
eukprot:357667-Lingulodinium_polyedra.AAC.1